MKKINDWVIRTFGLRGSWSWAKKQMLNGAIIKRKATIGTYKITVDNDKNQLDTNVTCDKHEQNKAIRKSQNS